MGNCGSCASSRSARDDEEARPRSQPARLAGEHRDPGVATAASSPRPALAARSRPQNSDESARQFLHSGFEEAFMQINAQMQGGQRPGRRSPTSSPRGHHGRRARGIAGGTTPEDLGFLANAGLGGRSLFQVQMDGRNNAPFPQPGETNMLAPLLPLLDQLLFNMDRSVTQQPSQQQQHTNAVAAASGFKIRQLPVRKLRPNDPLCDCVSGLPGHEADEGTCQICLDVYEEGDSVKTLPCFHSYHSSCIDDWLRRSGICPICRIDISNPEAPNTPTGVATGVMATTDIEPEEIQSSSIMIEVVSVGPPHGGSAAAIEEVV